METLEELEHKYFLLEMKDKWYSEGYRYTDELNEGFKFNFDEQKLLNKKVGLVFREKFERFDGETKTATKPFYAISYNRTEEAKIPNKKELPQKGEAFEDFVNSVNSDNDDLPF